MILLAFWAGFASCGILILGGLWLLNKLGFLGHSSAHYEALLAKHQSTVDSQLFKLSDDFNKALSTINTQLTHATSKPNPYYLPEDADLKRRLSEQADEEYLTSGGAGGI